MFLQCAGDSAWVPGLKKCAAAWSVGSRISMDKVARHGMCYDAAGWSNAPWLTLANCERKCLLGQLGLDDSDGGGIMNLWNRILVAAVMSWAYSVTLGLLFAVVVSEDHSLRTLLLPGVVPVDLTGSSVVSISITPVAGWTVCTVVRNW